MKEPSGLTMKELPRSEQPYVLIEEKGPRALTDAQLLAILLKTGTEGEKALDLATRLLKETESKKETALRHFFSLGRKELMSFKGIGRVKALQILALKEIARRLSSENAREQFTMEDPSTVADLLMEDTVGDIRENAYVLYVNSKMKLIGEILLSRGTLNHTLIDAREIILKGFELGAYGFILVHSHPSGDPSPSHQDHELTRAIYEKGKTMGLEMLDHLILGDHRYYSYRENGSLRAAED